MAAKLQHSKFRHLLLVPNKSDRSMQNITCSSGGHSDSPICDVGRKHIAIVLESQSGGSFLVIRLDEYGRVPIDHFKVTGHSMRVLDVKWSPFDDNLVASCAEDSTVKSWCIPDSGLIESSLSDCLMECTASGKKITTISWHPTAMHIIGGLCSDSNVYIWRIDVGERLFIAQHPNTVQSFAWNFDGTLFATTCRDQKIRCWDAYKRELSWVINGHQSNKQSKLCFCGSTNYLCSTGFNNGQRELTLWITKEKSITMSLDSASSVLYPFYDEDTMVISVLGKGDTTVRFYQVFKTDPQLQFLTLSQDAEPIKGFGFLPKSEIDFMNCEIARLYLLKGTVLQPNSITVKRLTSVFQEDLFSYYEACEASMNAIEFIEGVKRGRKMLRFVPKGAKQDPCIIKTIEIEGTSHITPDQITVGAKVVGQNWEASSSSQSYDSLKKDFDSKCEEVTLLKSHLEIQNTKIMALKAEITDLQSRLKSTVSEGDVLM